MRRLCLGLLTALAVPLTTGCGDGPIASFFPTTRRVEIVYTQSFDPANQITGIDLLSNRTGIATCVNRTVEPHLVPTWIEAGLTLTAGGGGSYRLEVEVPTHVELGVAVRDPAACTYHHSMQGEYYVIRGVTVNDVELTRVIGTDTAPKLAFRVTADGQVIP